MRALSFPHISNLSLLSLVLIMFGLCGCSGLTDRERSLLDQGFSASDSGDWEVAISIGRSLEEGNLFGQIPF